MKKLLVLGRGYVGRALQKYAQDQFTVITASRSEGAQVEFDLLRKDTWSNLGSAELCIWTFPAAPVDLVKEFWGKCGKQFGRLVVIGTTGSIVVDNPHEVVTEDSNFETSAERSPGEFFLLEQGAIIVHSAGIYGNGRDPRDWVMRGLVGPEDRFVNFIHIDDLCQFLVAAGTSQYSSQRFLAADGNPKRWIELIEAWKRDYNLVLPAECKSSKRSSKQIDPSQSIKALGVQLKYKSVNEGLKELN